MLSIYTSEITPRLQYISEFIGKELFDKPCTITTDKQTFLNSNNFKINYSNEVFSNDTYHIAPVSLLFQNNITEHAPDVFNFENNKALYKSEGDFPFDIFAASFYLITRYEEYLDHEEDEYGRYAHINSLAYREGFLELPLINIWLVSFKDSLQSKYPGLLFKRLQFSCNITYDIDIAYSFLYKGISRTIAGFVRSLLKGNWREIDDRWLVLTGKKQDPFDCFEWLDALHLYCRIKPYYFFLVAKKQEGYDKNISTDVKQFRELIEYYASKYEVGLHPSWKSGDNPGLLKEELEWLEVVTDKPVISSRQHYIRFKTPETFRTLINAGLKHEFSMGYGSINGFRASVCSSYKWYDLQHEKPTELVISPFCFMDANSYYEQKQTPEQTYMELVKYYELVKKLNGNFIPIWHNHILGSDPQFKGWKEMFEVFMKETVYWDAYSDMTVV
ncbi:MAG: hypothetical protein EOO01_14440 [Chitinophagaceae bacterium]|nr:MAG: hypothetical protein EOO01_14440 [Chitinophagaceae bacterium]